MQSGLLAGYSLVHTIQMNNGKEKWVAVVHMKNTTMKTVKYVLLNVGNGSALHDLT